MGRCDALMAASNVYAAVHCSTTCSAVVKHCQRSHKQTRSSLTRRSFGRSLAKLIAMDGT